MAGKYFWIKDGRRNMSEWYEIDNQEDVELSEDGKRVHVLFNTTDQGNQYVDIPVEFITGVLNTRPGWISVEDRLPEKLEAGHYTNVLIFSQHVFAAKWHWAGKFYIALDGRGAANPTHWQPLPPPPDTNT